MCLEKHKIPENQETKNILYQDLHTKSFVPNKQLSYNVSNLLSTEPKDRPRQGRTDVFSALQLLVLCYWLRLRKLFLSVTVNNNMFSAGDNSFSLDANVYI